MKAKLIKYPENEWVVEVPEDNKGIKGSMMQGHFASTFGHGYKLSLKNCQAIERGYDLSDLLDIRAEILNSYLDGTKWQDDIDKLLTKYREVIELMGDKKFNEKDMKFIFECGRNYQVTGDADCNFYNAIQSLQKNELDVDIEMRSKDIDELRESNEGFLNNPNLYVPKLDADDCIILKLVKS